MTNLVCDLDGFGAAMEGILEGILEDTERPLPTCVRDACKVGRKAVKANALSSFSGTGKYASSFRISVKSKAHGVSGEIGSSKLPGLVHLLEKGHAKVGGGRVEGRPHMAPAAEEAFEAFEKYVDEAIGSL